MALTKVSYSDNEKLELGTGDDLKIWHSGSHSFIQDEGTGNLYIDSNQLYLRNADTDNVLLQTTSAGATVIKYNGSDTNKIETTTTGVTMTSPSHDGGLKILPGNNNQESRLHLQGKAANGTAHDWYLSAQRNSDTFSIHNGTTSWLTIADAGDTTFAGWVYGDRFINSTTSEDPWLKGVNASGTETSYIKKDGTAYFAGAATTTHLTVATSGNSEMLLKDTSANAVVLYMTAKTGGTAEYNSYKEGDGSQKYPHVFMGYTTEYARIDTQGIKFNGDTAEANGLDDYEEGTFALNLSGSSGSITEGSDNTISYTKIGRQVFISGRIYISAISSPTGYLTLSGLPFANQAASETAEKAYIAVIPHGWTYDADGLWWELVAGASTGQVQRQKTGLNHDNRIEATAVAAASYLVITGSYHAST